MLTEHVGEVVLDKASPANGVMTPLGSTIAILAGVGVAGSWSIKPEDLGGVTRVFACFFCGGRILLISMRWVCVNPFQ